MSVFRISYNVPPKLPLNVFIQLFGAHISYFTLTYRYYTDRNRNRFRKDSSNARALEKLLIDYKIKEFSTTEWYCMQTIYPIDILVYHFSEDSAKILCKFIDTIDLQTYDGSVLDIPEDICFFRKDRSLSLGSVSHEGIIDLYLTPDEKSKILLPKSFKEYSCNDENEMITLTL